MGATITNNGNGTFSYDPTSISGLEGLAVGTYADSFTYTAKDGHGDISNTATVSFTLDVTAETVTATAVDGGTVNEDGTTTISVVSAVSAAADDHIASYAGDLTSVLGATITNNGNGTFSYDPTSISVLEDLAVGTYADSFTYTAKDGHGDISNTATVSFTLDVTAETVTATAVAGGTVNEDGTTTISVVSAVSAAADDHIASYAGDATSVLGATITNNNDGTFSYNPTSISGLENLAVGTYADSITYTAKDGHGDVSNTATVSFTLDVTAETVTATAVAGGTVNEDGTTTISVVSAVSAAVDDHIASYAGDATSVLGATITNNGNGTFSYDPTSISGLENLAVGTYADSFTYTATDGHGDVTNTTTVSFPLAHTSESG